MLGLYLSIRALALPLTLGDRNLDEMAEPSAAVNDSKANFLGPMQCKMKK